MDFKDLPFNIMELLAARWPLMTKDERLEAADAYNVTIDTITRQLQFWRQFMSKIEAVDVLPATESGPAAFADADNLIAEAEPAHNAPLLPAAVVPAVTLRSAVFDIETTDFDADGYAGILVCCSVLPLDTGEPYTLSLVYEDGGDDRRLLKAIIQDLSQYEILIGHNIAAYDFNFLHTKWTYHNAHGSDVGDWRRWLYIDTYQNTKNASTLKTRKGLGALGDYFGLSGVKTVIYRPSWSQIRSPYKSEFDAALANIIYHCEQDVILNRNLLNILWQDWQSVGIPIRRTKWGYIPGAARQQTQDAA